MGVLGELFLTFVKIGLFTFGGGYAMISVIEHICVEDKQWISHDDMMNTHILHQLRNEICADLRKMFDQVYVELIPDLPDE